jgi:hypothetical protein
VLVSFATIKGKQNIQISELFVCQKQIFGCRTDVIQNTFLFQCVVQGMVWINTFPPKHLGFGINDVMFFSSKEMLLRGSKKMCTVITDFYSLFVYMIRVYPFFSWYNNLFFWYVSKWKWLCCKVGDSINFNLHHAKHFMITFYCYQVMFSLFQWPGRRFIFSMELIRPSSDISVN